MTTKRLTYTFATAISGIPKGTVATFDITYSETLAKNATSYSVNVKLISVTIPNQTSPLTVPVSVKAVLRKASSTELASNSILLIYPDAANKTETVNIPGIPQPITGNRGSSNVNLDLVIFVGNGNTQYQAASYPVTTPNADSMLAPSVSIPSDAQPSYILSPGAGFPEGWPLLSNTGGGFANVRLDKSWVATYTGSSVSYIAAQLLFIDDGKPLTMTAPVEMTLDGDVYSCSVGLHANSATSIAPVFIVADSAGRDTDTQGPALAVQAYRKPSVAVSAERCDEDGEFDDEGLYARLGVDVSLFQPSGVSADDANRIVSAKAYCYIGGQYTAFDLDLSSDPVVIGGSFQMDESYNLSVSVTDLVGTGSGGAAIDTAYATMDFLAGGKGIAFGTTVTKEGFECDMESYFDKPVHVVDKFTIDKTLTEFTTGGNEYHDYPIFSFDPETGVGRIRSVVDGFPVSVRDFWIYNTDAMRSAVCGKFVCSDRDYTSEFVVWDPDDSILRLTNVAFQCYNSADNTTVFKVTNNGTTHYSEFNQPIYFNTGNGKIIANANSGTSWRNGRTGATLRTTICSNADSFWPVVSAKSKDGAWTMGTINATTNSNDLAFSYTTDTNFNANANTNSNLVYFRGVTGYTAASNADKANTIIINGTPLWAIIYPVGAVYISYVSTSPASLFGGKWTPLTGHYLRMDNGNGTGGADSHTHGLYGTGVALYSMGNNTDYYAYVNFDTWWSNYKTTNAGTTASGGTSHGTAMRLHGSTGNNTANPTYQNLYAWRRTE